MNQGKCAECSDGGVTYHLGMRRIKSMELAGQTVEYVLAASHVLYKSTNQRLSSMHLQRRIAIYSIRESKPPASSWPQRSVHVRTGRNLVDFKGCPIVSIGSGGMGLTLF